MGLLNVYSFNKTIKPHLAYRFKVTFFYNKGAEEIESLTYYVKSVDLPVWNMNTENRQRFGNTQYVIPIFDFGQSTLKIVFMETDKMSVTYFLNGFLFNNIENADLDANLWNNCSPQIIKIKIDELDQSMRSTIVSNIYACHLKRLSSPNFSNTNFGTPVEIEAEFVVRYKLNTISEEVGSIPRELPDPETFMSDVINARTQEEFNKDVATGAYNKANALVAERKLTQSEIDAILMKQSERLGRAKSIAADRRATKLENARADADKNGRLKDGRFVTAKEKAEYIKKKQAEAKQQSEKIKEEQAYIYDTYGVDITKVKSVDELSIQLKGKLSDDDAADLVEAIRSINQASEDLKKTKTDIWKADNARVVELESDVVDKQYLGTDEKSLGFGGQKYAEEYADASNQIALLEKRNELLKNNASDEEILEIDRQLAAANGINLKGTDYSTTEKSEAGSTKKSNLGISGTSGNPNFEAFKNSSRQDGLCARNTLNAVNAYYDTGYISSKGSGKDIAGSSALAAELKNNKNIENVEQLGKQKITSVSDINKLQSTLLDDNQTMVVSIKFTDKKAAMAAGISANSAEHGHSMFVTQKDIVSSKNQKTISTYNEKAMSELIRQGLVEVSVLRITNKTS